MNPPFHACFALDQLFVTQGGAIRACCMAQSAFVDPGGNVAEAFARKRATNEAIIDRNDASTCWPDCPARHPVPNRPDPAGIHKIVVDTNTFCPARCSYCSQAYPADAAEWGQPGGLASQLAAENSAPLEDWRLGKWAARNRESKFVPPVQFPGNNQPRLLETLRRLLDATPRAEDLWVEFSGGDSAFHPEFLPAVDLLMTRGAKLIYLSSGLLPNAAVPPLLEHLRTGRLYITVSTDAATPETWARIKRKPAKLFDTVLDFLAAAAHHQAHNQVAAKFIVMRENAADADTFIPFFASLGLRKFVVSEYRSQPVFFVPPPDETETAALCRVLWRSFVDSYLPPECELVLVGVERHFGNRAILRKAEVLFAGF